MSQPEHDLMTRLAASAPPTPDVLDGSLRRGRVLRLRRTAWRGAAAGTGVAALATVAVFGAARLAPSEPPTASPNDGASATQSGSVAAVPKGRDPRQIAAELLAPYGTISGWSKGNTPPGTDLYSFTLTDAKGAAGVDILLGDHGQTNPSCLPDIEGCMPMAEGGFSAVITDQTHEAQPGTNHSWGDISGYVNRADGHQVAATFWNSLEPEGPGVRDQPALTAEQVRAFLTDEAWAEAAFPGPDDGLPEPPVGGVDMLGPDGTIQRS